MVLTYIERSRLLAALACFCIAGCVTGPVERPFSDRWAFGVRHEQEFKARKARIEGNKSSRRSRIFKTDSEGKTSVGIGGSNGLGVEVDPSDSEGKVRYRFEW